MSEKQKKTFLNTLKNPITLVAGLIFLVGLIIIGVVIILWGREPVSIEHVTPQVTKIEAPTLTPKIPPTSTATTQTPTESTSVSDGFIEIGVYVQVSGTEGAGLRMRAGPGLDRAINFTALDSEVFLVIDGPVEADGYNWWLLEAPYDQARNGWSAGAFLIPIYEED